MMSCFLLSVWRSSLILCLGQLLRCGEARVNTEVQAGPLYRVLGSPLYITCSVSGFRSENTDKHFEFRMTRPSNPNMDNQIISSHEDNFGYSNHLDRVRKNEIALKRLSPNSVRFEIKSLLKSDEGEYECTAVNLEGAYDGEYSAKTVVKVIEDSLSVSSSASTPLSLNEGEALTLTCLASSSTSQHTHLSVAWYLHKDGQEDAQPIISLNRDFTLSPGQGFERRYQAGLIRLDKWGEASYSLKMAEVEPSDQGRIYCQAQEWIQDPDGSWYIIIQKNAEEMTLTVKATEVVEPSSPSLAVEISAQPAALQEGQELMLSCNINTQDVGKRFFSVAWLKGRVELARIGPTGVLTVAPEYSVRQKNGELRAARSGNRDYRLILKPVKTEDKGEYICTVWPQERGQDDTFIEGEPKDSSPQRVSVSATENRLTVKMQQAVNVAEGGGLHLFCKVDGVQGQLSITWEHKSTPTAPFTKIISISQEGVTEIAEEFMSRKVRVMRPTTDNFTLVLDEVTLFDSGVYQCAVSERKPNSKTHNQAQTTTVTVTSIDTLMGVSLSSRKTRVTVGEKLELMCRVRGPHMPVTVTWSVQREAKTPDTILTLSPDGTINWSADQNHYQLRVESRKTEVMYYLLVIGTSHREGGSYQCNVSVLLKNVHKELKASNQLAVIVNNPANDLRLDKKEQQLTAKEGEEVELNCNITSGASGSSVFYRVIWHYAANSSSLKKASLVELDHTGLVSYSDNKDITGPQERLRLSRPTQKSFYLSIQKAHEEDNGTYWCQVDQYQLDNEAHWQLKASDSGGAIKLSVIVTENNLSVSKKDTAMNISRNQDLTIPCNINKQSSHESKFQVTWFWQKEIETTERPIFTVYRNSILQDRFGENVRLRYDHPDPSQFSLTFLNPGPENSGLYFCEVEEWLPSLSRGWRTVAVEKSGHLNVSVLTEGSWRGWSLSQPPQGEVYPGQVASLQQCQGF
ncbi:immunoglobulin superfamily member 3-like [Pelmatolapia mariae]|uniref:immunoglobulin superfamily member 3-like n=1 Tax=Pelmatolapia mariae TaxID=158779 RepID=UPI002FE6AD9C